MDLNADLPPIAKLRRQLATLYETAGKARLVAEDVHIQLELIDFAVGTGIFWDEILKAAKKQNLFSELYARVCTDYPRALCSLADGLIGGEPINRAPPACTSIPGTPPPSASPIFSGFDALYHLITTSDPFAKLLRPSRGVLKDLCDRIDVLYC